MEINSGWIIITHQRWVRDRICIKGGVQIYKFDNDLW